MPATRNVFQCEPREPQKPHVQPFAEVLGKPKWLLRLLTTAEAVDASPRPHDANPPTRHYVFIDPHAISLTGRHLIPLICEFPGEFTDFCRAIPIGASLLPHTRPSARRQVDPIRSPLSWPTASASTGTVGISISLRIRPPHLTRISRFLASFWPRIWAANPESGTISP